MAISEKAIKAIIDIEQGFQRAQAIVDDMELMAWAAENKGDIKAALAKIQPELLSIKEKNESRDSEQKVVKCSSVTHENGSVTITIYNDER